MLGSPTWACPQGQAHVTGEGHGCWTCTAEQLWAQRQAHVPEAATDTGAWACCTSQEQVASRLVPVDYTVEQLHTECPSDVT
mmetsp:Transcript_28082/g.72193  ORF Transcript_28082/g.72193 Transcript_28082/m.72193 type:complete len:82 (-) Transcript_28082:555-800(-)|eukprot:1162106-Pelagomonas_calceolata.AAC.11